MPVQLDMARWPQASQLEVDIHLSAPLRVTAAEARKRVSKLVISEIGNLLYGGEPTLTIADRICWRVPVLLAFPDSGVVGQAGALDVDVETGAVLTTDEQLSHLSNYAAYHAERTTPVAA